jgi:hypothetical protein
MTVKRIVANFSVADPGSARAFYEKMLDLTVVMDHGWNVLQNSTRSSSPAIIESGRTNFRINIAH